MVIDAKMAQWARESWEWIAGAGERRGASSVRSHAGAWERGGQNQERGAKMWQIGNSECGIRNEERYGFPVLRTGLMNHAPSVLPESRRATRARSHAGRSERESAPKMATFAREGWRWCLLLFVV